MSRLSIFLSYKSEDAVAVRMIAELLKAQNIDVWFAEYRIHPKDRAVFQDKIDAAIGNCTHGICFTNDRYAASTYCGREIEQLLARLSADNILEIGFPEEENTHRRYPALSDCPRLAVAVSGSSGGTDALPESDAKRILHFIEEHIQTELVEEVGSVPDYEKRVQDKVQGVVYSIDAAGWMLNKPSLWLKLYTWGQARTRYERTLPDGARIWGHLMVGKQDVSRAPPLHVGDSDDRDYYEAALAFASSYYAQHGQHCLGTHLLFANGYSHPAFTTVQRHATPAFLRGADVFMRLYSIVLPGRRPGSRNIEYAFFFFFRGHFFTFERHAHLMDRLVLSLRQQR